MDPKTIMNELLQARELIETSLRQSLTELEEMGVGPNDSLLDAQGYPRTDIDLYRVRSLRSSIASISKNKTNVLILLLYF